MMKKRKTDEMDISVAATTMQVAGNRGGERVRDFIRKRNEWKDKVAYCDCPCDDGASFPFDKCDECNEYLSGDCRKRHTWIRALTPSLTEVAFIAILAIAITGGVALFMVITGAGK